MVLAYVLPTWWLYLRLERTREDISGNGLALGFAFAAVQIVVILGLLTTAQIMKTRKRMAEKRGARVRPQIRAALGGYVVTGGEAERRQLAQFFATHFHESEECLLESLASIVGMGRQRLVELAVELGFVSAWQKKARARSADRRRDGVQKLGLVIEARGQDALLAALSDEDLMVRMEAARALVRQGSPDALAAVFDLLPEQEALFRATLVEDLERHAITLSAKAIPDALSSGDSARIRTCLDVVAAWQRALPMPGLAPLLEFPDPEVRLRALAVLPLAFDFPATAAAILHALEDPVPQVRASSARAAGRLKIADAAPLLSQCLNTTDTELARAAAEALGELGPAGWGILDTAIVAGTPVPAAAAVEALERARLHPVGNTR